MSDLTAMKQCRNQPVDKEALFDIRNVDVNQNQPIRDKILEFIRQIGNPYLFKCGDKVVRIHFSNTKTTFEEKIKGYFDML